MPALASMPIVLMPSSLMSAPGARNPAGSAVPLRPSVARRLAVGPTGNGTGDDRNGQATSAYTGS